MAVNPFRIHGVVEPPDFTDREPEVARISAALTEPGGKLLVYGERRMGKTSALRVALAGVAERAAGCLADFSTASSPVDLANRVLDGATKALGRRWRDVAQELARRIGLSLTIGSDPTTQAPTLSLDLGLRDAPVGAQHDTLGRVLDSLEGIAADRRVTLGLVLDEFQEIHRVGGEEAEWHLRGVIQHHKHLSYIVAGSRTHLIRRMLSRGRAFYKLFDLLPFGPIDAAHLASWIDERMTTHGVSARGAGAAAAALAGPRTRDVVQLARKTFDLGCAAGVADGEAVQQAFLEIVQEEDEPIRALWEGLTPHQQNLLRAVSVGGGRLTAAITLRRFALKSSSATSQAAARFVEEGLLEQLGRGQYRIDSPFFQGWIVLKALPDLGIHLPVTHRPS
ncbi:MAG: ATP-binding protein [Gemmatimonadetes bacterium]|nr:ATP-binding protein [Gemmatimonadota bacterium]